MPLDPFIVWDALQKMSCFLSGISNRIRTSAQNSWFTQARPLRTLLIPLTQNVALRVVCSRVLSARVDRPRTNRSNALSFFFLFFLVWSGNIWTAESTPRHVFVLLLQCKCIHFSPASLLPLVSVTVKGNANGHSCEICFFWTSLCVIHSNVALFFLCCLA